MGTQWQVEDIDQLSIAECVSIVLDDLNKPHLAYAVLGEDPRLRYTDKSGADWVYESSATGHGIGYVSLALDSQRQPRVLYYLNQTGTPLMLGTKEDGVWRHEQVREYGHPGYGGRALEIDSQDALHFVFTSYTNPRSVDYGQ